MFVQWFGFGFGFWGYVAQGLPFYILSFGSELVGFRRGIEKEKHGQLGRSVGGIRGISTKKNNAVAPSAVWYICLFKA